MPEPESESFDPRRRKLCPDGSCVGVIGASGVCRICGRQDDDPAGLGPHHFAGGCASGDEDDGEDDDAKFPGDDRAIAAAGEVGRAEAQAAVEAEKHAFDPNRQLCLDGGCVGVIGLDGKCTECGRPSGPAAAVE
jgi:hypothetical protein